MSSRITHDQVRAASQQLESRGRTMGRSVGLGLYADMTADYLANVSAMLNSLAAQMEADAKAHQAATPEPTFTEAQLARVREAVHYVFYNARTEDVITRLRKGG